jgi:hypothetical protein
MDDGHLHPTRAIMKNVATVPRRRRREPEFSEKDVVVVHEREVGGGGTRSGERRKPFMQRFRGTRKKKKH